MNVDKNANAAVAPNLNPPGFCSRMFHKALPFLIGLGSVSVLFAIGALVHIHQGGIDAATEGGWQIAGLSLGAVGSSILGLNVVGRQIWMSTTETQYKRDSLNVWMFLTFALLLTGFLLAYFDIEGSVGFAAFGGAFAIVAYYMAEGVNDYVAKNPNSDYHVTWKNSPFRTWWNPCDIFYPKNSGVEGADKPENYDRQQDKKRQDREARFHHSDDSGAQSEQQNVSRKEDAQNHGYFRRLASVADQTSIVSTLFVTLASFLVWFLFFRGQSSQDKSRRRTTIIKKRPTFVKGKRRSSHRPTLSTLRSEGNLLAN